MIKYFSYEITENDQTSNEKIIDDDPKVDYTGYNFEQIGYDTYRVIIDVEKRIEFNKGLLDEFVKEIYDKLLQQERNQKLETLL